MDYGRVAWCQRRLAATLPPSSTVTAADGRVSRTYQQLRYNMPMVEMNSGLVKGVPINISTIFLGVI